jgi:hypothetical protein
MAAGGQGAPLAPAFHRALVRQLHRDPPIAVLNLGGVANLTYVDGDELIACDTGPGNALLDDFLRLRTGDPLDTDGRKAAAGTVDALTVERLLAHPFFALPSPNSLDRNEFHSRVGAALDGCGFLDCFVACAPRNDGRMMRQPTVYVRISRLSSSENARPTSSSPVRDFYMATASRAAMRACSGAIQL